MIAADKFHANCYSYSSPVHSMHGLLRQKPYNVMWGGNEIFEEEDVGNILTSLSTQELLGLSIFLDREHFERSSENLENESYHDIIKFIDDNHKLWKKIDNAEYYDKYFYPKKITSVEYSGYLLNRTQKLAVNLVDYYARSKYVIDGICAAIDPLPVLTETGGDLGMAMLEAASFDTTEDLAGTWCGDLLQIVDSLPKNYKVINCCFAELWSRAKYCFAMFGVDKNGYILGNKEGDRFKCTLFNVILGNRRGTCYVKTERNGNKIKVATELVT